VKTSQTVMVFRNGTIAFIGIGSNMGDKLRRCEERFGDSENRQPHPVSEILLLQDTARRLHLTGLVCQRSDQDRDGVGGLDLLHVLKTIETRLGAWRRFDGGPAIDLDILLFDGTCIETLK